MSDVGMESSKVSVRSIYNTENSTAWQCQRSKIMNSDIKKIYIEESTNDLIETSAGHTIHLHSSLLISMQNWTKQMRVSTD